MVGEKTKKVPLPFTTSTLQQEAAKQLNFPTQKTMRLAQQLYEGIDIAGHGTIGIITYLRTDSTRVAKEAQLVAADYIKEVYGEEYVSEHHKSKAKDDKQIQDAHEAIRPTYVDLTPEKVKSSLTNDQYKLYNLIYNRFIASQMSSAEYDTISVTINAGEYNFKANGQSIKFKGFMKLYVETKDQDNGEDDELLLPSLELNQKLKNEKIDIKQSFTEPPARYTEASLVKTLEEKGAIVEEFDLGLVEYAIPAYYVIAAAEASSNLERFDGVKYGFRAKDYDGLHSMYKKTRSEGFGPEVKRRIMLGSFVLSSGYYDAYYLKALRVKAMIKKAFDEAFAKYDVILGPVAPTTAPKLGSSLADPIKMYLGDIYTISVNLAGLPGISVPCGKDDNGLPIGVQLIGDCFNEKKLIQTAYAYEQARGKFE